MLINRNNWLQSCKDEPKELCHQCYFRIHTGISSRGLDSTTWMSSISKTRAAWQWDRWEALESKSLDRFHVRAFSMPVHAKQSAEFMAGLPLPLFKLRIHHTVNHFCCALSAERQKKLQFLKCHRADSDQIFPKPVALLGAASKWKRILDGGGRPRRADGIYSQAAKMNTDVSVLQSARSNSQTGVASSSQMKYQQCSYHREQKLHHLSD